MFFQVMVVIQDVVEFSLLVQSSLIEQDSRVDRMFVMGVMQHSRLIGYQPRQVVHL